jgi:Fe-S-cluster containining protein
MNLDFTTYFKEYEKLTSLADEVFKRVINEYPECYRCKKGCSDCCYALFDIGLVEALYINHHFKEKFQNKEPNREANKKQEKIIERANKADRTVYKLKRDAYKEVVEKGKSEDEIIARMALERIMCPLLNDDDKCSLYEYRPITCRLYGIPISIAEMSHTCGRSGFKEKNKYQTVKMEIIQNKLYEISFKLIADIKSKHPKIAEMLVPVSMALLANYDEEFFQINSDNKAEKEA